MTKLEFIPFSEGGEGYVRVHMARHHGYGTGYASDTAHERLRGEHDRLHADPTARNLDHEHVTPE